ncbi:hypothetical protein, variant 2 [Aphanomyces astaci]|uniref:Uncharacterized protein n=1 Tax=Aphanomyces astaci TaxID=112090 RepID=W4H935_APHAT|nr:hypothetical protein H257_01253 [Aphanomyces astaci]XP_009822663.1 hypothetical protein, variant 1 [Aphanomyces astaci]XP_009822664.1 hypothetical protein, variant 3 [Aphanomyces astaci]XP_009822665.1 hypothetical protein, variant 2 [Aphanomyces astaci]ETV87799.1 hypothetical protein H257_01253 [Aphanomyces astaci]ETV87800.1 hypothetical protein, variant 1 [Aphanomyces astaci]ETV87801.1 hypothetical protein, variant 2 [Aphanomyces astaci]ETV87802.1 hypothetical protein, variant 3 [Aphanom|eukprot:XP_009822662.1 hypothetical protein H257_01253 [Aphanomyces astaci]
MNLRQVSGGCYGRCGGSLGAVDGHILHTRVHFKANTMQRHGVRERKQDKVPQEHQNANPNVLFALSNLKLVQVIDAVRVRIRRRRKLVKYDAAQRPRDGIEPVHPPPVRRNQVGEDDVARKQEKKRHRDARHRLRRRDARIQRTQERKIRANRVLEHHEDGEKDKERTRGRREAAHKVEDRAHDDAHGQVHGNLDDRVCNHVRNRAEKVARPLLVKHVAKRERDGDALPRLPLEDGDGEEAHAQVQRLVAVEIDHAKQQPHNQGFGHFPVQQGLVPHKEHLLALEQQPRAFEKPHAEDLRLSCHERDALDGRYVVDRMALAQLVLHGRVDVAALESISELRGGHQAWRRGIYSHINSPSSWFDGKGLMERVWWITSGVVLGAAPRHDLDQKVGRVGAGGTGKAQPLEVGQSELARPVVDEVAFAQHHNVVEQLDHFWRRLQQRHDAASPQRLGPRPERVDNVKRGRRVQPRTDLITQKDALSTHEHLAHRHPLALSPTHAPKQRIAHHLQKRSQLPSHLHSNVRTVSAQLLSPNTCNTSSDRKLATSASFPGRFFFFG